MHAFWCHGCFVSELDLRHLEKTPNFVPVNSIWQVADLDRERESQCEMSYMPR